MTADYQTTKLAIFIGLNFIVSLIVWALFPNSVFGGALIYMIFAIKMILLLWFNDFPTDRSLPSLMFFLFATLDVITIFLMGSFSIFSLLLGLAF